MGEPDLTLGDLVRAIVGSTGTRSAPKITDSLLAAHWPKSRLSTKQEGVWTLFRSGVLYAVEDVLKALRDGDTKQEDFSKYCSGFEHIIERLKNGSYYVPSLKTYKTVGWLLHKLPYFDEARRAHRKKGDEVLAESDVLDELFDAASKKAAAKRKRPPRPTDAGDDPRPSP